MNDILEFAPCGYIRFYETGTIAQINSTLAKWIGAPKQSIEGQLIQSLFPKAGQIFLQSYIFPQLKFSSDLEECHFKLLTRSGERIPVLGNFYWSDRDRFANDRPDGQPVLYDVIIIRAHKRHELENALVLAQQKADAAVIELQKSNDSLGRFANMVAHDLKSPLRNINRLVEYLIDDYEDVLDEDGKDLLQKLDTTSQRAIYFVEKLLEYGSLGASSTLNEVNLNTAVTIASDTFSELISTTATTLRIDMLPTVMGIETQLIQLFQNTIGNAIKYRSPDRSPIIEISAIQITEREYKISVKDNGVGIPVKYQQEIFDILYRLHGKDYEGAGIGLATCKWIIQNHGGTIGVDSKVGRGSTFYFTLLAAKL
jgi:light-regulated signal transduction histidine kinase (bacteriophytochrome)